MTFNHFVAIYVIHITKFRQRAEFWWKEHVYKMTTTKNAGVKTCQ